MAWLRRGLATASLLSLSLAALLATAAGPVDVADARLSFCITCHGANAQGNPGVAARTFGNRSSRPVDRAEERRFAVYFSLDRPTAAAYGVSPADVLITTASSPRATPG